MPDIIVLMLAGIALWLVILPITMWVEREDRIRTKAKRIPHYTPRFTNGRHI